ncbi:FAD/NAD(P)-binding domain-containing protein [Meredithblackwellia eburnea MCA 4105]
MPQKRVLKVAIVGGGMSGIAQAVRLVDTLGSQADFKIYERADSPGGVWRDSTWPGAGVDIPIHLYQLYSELNPSWSEKFARRDEVLAYWIGIIEKYKLWERFVFGANFTGSHWDTVSQSHDLTFKLKSGEELKVNADVIISAAGALNTPIIPELPGRDTFKGEQWHSSRWNNQYSLEGKKVAVVGNGSSGIQVVPNIANVPGIQITQFFRSAGYFTPKVNFQYTAFQKWVFRWIPGFQRLYRFSLFYQLERANLTKGNADWSSKQREIATRTLVGYLKAKAPAEYHDILVPKYPLHCKRVAYNQGWLESLHKPNVDLIAKPITSVSPTGLVTDDGVNHPFDVIVWATGFDVSGTGVGLNHGVYGEEGIELRKLWEEAEGSYAYLAIGVPKFPNYFTVIGPNAISQSWGFTLGNQSLYIARLLKGLLDRNLTSLSPKEEVTRVYNEKIQARLEAGVMGSTNGCSAWYRFRGVGKAVAPSGHAGTELVLKTRKIRWEDWEGRKRDANGKAVLTELRTPTSWSPVQWISDWAANWLQAKLISLTWKQ